MGGVIIETADSHFVNEEKGVYSLRTGQQEECGIHIHVFVELVRDYRKRKAYRKQANVAKV